MSWGENLELNFEPTQEELDEKVSLIRQNIDKFWVDNFSSSHKKNTLISQDGKEKENIYDCLKDLASKTNDENELTHLTLAQILAIDDPLVDEVYQIDFDPKNYEVKGLGVVQASNKFKTYENTVKINEVLIKAVDFCNVNNLLPFKIRLPNSQAKLEHHKNYIAQHLDQQNLIYARELHQLHQNFLAEGRLEELGLEETLGLVTLDLIYESYILTEKSLLEVLKQLADEDNYFYQNGRLFFYTESNFVNNKRREFIAQHTELLTYKAQLAKKLQENLNLDIESSLGSFIVSYASILHPYFKNHSSKVQNWIDRIKPFLYERHNSLILTYSQNSHLFYSLKPKRISQIFLCDSPLEEPLEMTKGQVSRAQDPKEKDYVPSEVLSKIYKALDKEFGKEVTKEEFLEFKKEVNELKDSFHFYPNAKLLLEWFLSLIKYADKKIVGRKPRSVQRIAHSFARKLFAVLGDLELIDLSPEERHIAFLEVIDDLPSIAAREQVKSYLKKFNKWLETTQNLKPLDSSLQDDLETEGSFQDVVNANLITFDEYELAKERLSYLIKQHTGFKSAHRHKALLLLLILGFRLGLRIDEAYRLKANDLIVDAINPKVIIRESSKRKLKTANATREFSLGHLLDKAEIKFVNDFTEEVRKLLRLRGGKKSEWHYHYLFLNPWHKDFKLIPKDSLRKELLVDVLRVVCQDDEIRFHHLRHSFGSWMLLASLVTELKLDYKDYFSHLPKTLQWLDEAIDRKQKIFLTDENVTSGFFQVSRFLGHATPETSARHYVHFLELAKMMVHNQQDYSSTYLTKLTSLPKSTLDKKKHKVTYAVDKFIPKDLKDKKLQQFKLQQEKAKQNTLQPDIAELFKDKGIFEAMGSKWYEPFGIFHDVRGYPELQKKHKDIVKFFSGTNNSHLKFGNIYLKDHQYLDELYRRFQEAYDFDLNCREGYPESFIYLLNLLNNSLTSGKRVEGFDELPKYIELRVNNFDDANLIIQHLQKLGMEFETKLGLKQPLSNKELQTNDRIIRFWEKALKKFKASNPIIDDTDSKSTGKYGRLFISPLKGEKRVVMYFWASILTYWMMKLQSS